MDIIKSFMLEDGLFRGNYIAADKTVSDLWKKHDYPESLYPLFQQAVLIALALSSGIKYKGVFSLQVKGNGPVSSLFIDVTADKKVRGYMVFDTEKDYASLTALPDLFGRGQMIFSVAGLGQEPYQGIVGLNHNTLSEVVIDYFHMSEQIDTELILRQNKTEARCLFIQRMPNKVNLTDEEIADKWETVCVLLNSVQDSELFSDLTPDEILYRLFHANRVSVFDPITPVFECRCYRSKMENFLKKMSADERKSLYKDGKIDVSCQFCGEVYTFTKADFNDD